MLQLFGVVPTIQDGDLTLFGKFLHIPHNLSIGFFHVYISFPEGDLINGLISLVMSNRIESHCQIFGQKVQGPGHWAVWKQSVGRSPGWAVVWGRRTVLQFPCFDHNVSNPVRPNEGRHHRRSSSGNECGEGGKSVGYLRGEVVKEQVLGGWFLQLGWPATSADYPLPGHRLRKGRSDIVEKTCEGLVGRHLMSPCVEESLWKSSIMKRIDCRVCMEQADNQC